jgi:hypothetical protein
MGKVTSDRERFTDAEMLIRWILGQHYYKEIVRIVRANGETPYSTIEALVPFQSRYVRHYTERLCDKKILTSTYVGFGSFVTISCTPLGEFVIDSLDMILATMDEMGVTFELYTEKVRKRRAKRTTKKIREDSNRDGSGLFQWDCEPGGQGPRSQETDSD